MADLDFDKRIQPFVNVNCKRIEASLSVQKDRLYPKCVYVDSLVFGDTKTPTTSADRSFFSLALREYVRINWNDTLEVGKKYHCVIIPKTKTVTVELKK